jgi:hypothetical protein
MGDRSMKECLVEQLLTLNASLPKDGKRGGSRAMRWYDDGADVSQLQCVGANVNGLLAWGYLEGAADALDVTVQELLDLHRLDWSGSTRFSRAKEPRCPKCGSASHRCATGDDGCVHCDNEKCGHGWMVRS